MSEQLRDPDGLTNSEIEEIEKLSLRGLFQASVDFGFDAYDIFQQSTDDVKDVAEDITREMLDRLGGYHIQQRIFGNVDYRKARYVILPAFLLRQALFVDSKAEKSARTATLQMSQTSLTIHQQRGGIVHQEAGKLTPVVTYNGLHYLATTLLAHYHYDDAGGQRMLRTLRLAAVPNGRLQAKYNPSATDSIWLAGRNAPTLGEDFRVRLGFNALQGKARWRVQAIEFDALQRRIEYGWED